MKVRPFFIWLVTIISFMGCKPIKQVMLDPVQVNIAPENVYRGSYTKITDLINTKLDINFDWDSAFVIGKAYIEAKPYFYASNQVVLNANGFKINTVSLVKGDTKTPLTYGYDGKLLKITLDKTYTREQKFTIFIDYIAMPYKLKAGIDIRSNDDRGIYFINRDGKDKNVPKQIWTQGETECNSNWFPTINNTQEKMTQEISITVPNRMLTLSNGELDYSSDNGNGTHTDTWRQEKPHSTYLSMLAVGEFAQIKDKWRDKEVNYLVEPKYAPYAKLVFGKTPQMMEFFSKKLGVDFPWDKYSQVVVREFAAGAMENTSATVFFDRMNMDEGQYLDDNHEDIISHELFHQWFGDLVTAESWANLPLNESFATYGEYLWIENQYGLEEADYHALMDEDKYFHDPKNKELNLIRYNYADREQMFDNVTYEKGGLILNMLRKTVGDEAFFKSINLYLTKHAYKTAEISDLRKAFEETTGQDLNWFFNQWFMAAGNPKLAIKTTYDAIAKSVAVTINQEQDLAKSPLYRIPLAVDIYQNGQAERKQIVLTKQSQSFNFPVGTTPQLVNVDAEKYILADKIETKSVSEYSYQYEHAPLFLDRYEAIKKLQSSKSDALARQELVKALTDKHWYIRKMAVEFIPELPEAERNEVYVPLKSIALTDERSLVRAAAVSVLKKSFSLKDNRSIFMEAAKDKAPSVRFAVEKN